MGEGMPPPPKAQGVRISADREFGATFGRAIGFDEFTATAEATAVMGRLTGGTFLPLVLPVSPSECDKSGNLQPFDDPNKPAMWYMSNPGTSHPDGTEYVVPLCKTKDNGGGGGSFMFLDLDPDLELHRGGPAAALDPVRHLPRGHRHRPWWRLPDEGR